MTNDAVSFRLKPVGEETPTEGIFVWKNGVHCTHAVPETCRIDSKLFAGLHWSTTLLVGFSIDFPEVHPVQISEWPNYVPGVKGQ